MAKKKPPLTYVVEDNGEACCLYIDGILAVSSRYGPPCPSMIFDALGLEYKFYEISSEVYEANGREFPDDVDTNHFVYEYK